MASIKHADYRLVAVLSSLNCRNQANLVSYLFDDYVHIRAFVFYCYLLYAHRSGFFLFFSLISSSFPATYIDQNVIIIIIT